MFQNTNTWKPFVPRIRRLLSLALLAMSVAACVHPDIREPGGLVVGAVVSGAKPVFSANKQRSYANKLASHILYSNPHLNGYVDSYEYFSKRVGEPASAILKNYRLEGDLSQQALAELQNAQLRRRHLMLATIMPFEATIELSPEKEPVIGQRNHEVKDYYDVLYQTIRFAEIKVQVYDVWTGRKVFEHDYGSYSDGVSLANETASRKYVGNSVIAALTNSFSNGFGKSTTHPPAPARDEVINRIFQEIGDHLPNVIY